MIDFQDKYMFNNRSRRNSSASVSSSLSSISDGLDVFCSRPFRSPSFRVGHLLSLVQFVESHTFDAGRVEEYVLVASGGDESKPLVGQQSLDRTFCHFVAFLKKNVSAACPEQMRSDSSTAKVRAARPLQHASYNKLTQKKVQQDNQH